MIHPLNFPKFVDYKFNHEEWRIKIMKKLIYLVVVLAFGLTVGVASGVSVEMVKINFQPEFSDVPDGYIRDYGKKFSSQNGLQYGFDEDITDKTRERWVDPDQRYDTLIQIFNTDSDLPDRTWEIELVPGLYNIFIVCGDPAFTDQVNFLDIEGTEVEDPDGEDNFDEYTLTDMPVEDGRLTITTGEERYRNKLCFIHIELADVPAITVDSNDIPVYEQQDCAPGDPCDCGPPVPPSDKPDGQLLVSLAWQPGDGLGYPAFTATVTVDPNVVGPGPHADFTFPDSVAADGSVDLTFTEANWDVPQNVIVQVVSDTDREGEDEDSYPIELTVTIDIADPNFGSDPCSPVVVESSVGVVDNDVPFVSALPNEIELSENDPCVCVDVKVRLSHRPDYVVYVRVEKGEAGVFMAPKMACLDPPLEPDEGPNDPNIMTFTTVDDAAFDPGTMTSGWNVEQTITVCPIDNDELAKAWKEWIKGEIYMPPYSEDVRYLEETRNPDGSKADDPCTSEEEKSDGEADGAIVDVKVQDNECGAVGFAKVDANEDCTVGLGDIAYLYEQWLYCTDPYEDGCDKSWNQ